MITVGTTTVALDDARLWAAAAGLLLFLLLWRAVVRSGRAVEPLARHLAELDGAVRALNDGQQQLHGGITHVAEAQVAAQARLAQSLETRLGEVTQAMSESLGQNAVRTARSLGPSTGRRPRSRSFPATCSGCRTSSRTSRPAAPSARSSCARS
jgi:DNA recombination protein RmuC